MTASAGQSGAGDAGTVLVFGFEPYGGHAINPSERLVEALDGRRVAGRTVRGEVLPVRLAPLHASVEASLERHAPAAVVAFGLRPGERAICLERVAFNRNNFPIADDEGVRARGPVRDGEPERRPATLPLEAVRTALLAAGIPARRSDDAGRYLCNALMYALLSEASRRAHGPPAGFVHLPCLPGQVAAALAAHDGEAATADGAGVPASMSLELMTAAAEIVVATTLAAPAPA